LFFNVNNAENIINENPALKFTMNDEIRKGFDRFRILVSIFLTRS